MKCGGDVFFRPPAVLFVESSFLKLAAGWISVVEFLPCRFKIGLVFRYQPVPVWALWAILMRFFEVHEQFFVSVLI